MTTIPLRGIDFSGRILVPLHANGLLNEIQAVTNQRQKDSIVREIQKSIISIQHKLNVAFYQAVLIRSLKTDDYTLFELYPGRLSNSNVSHKICTYSMFNIDEYLLVLTFFIETFAATVFSLFDVSGSLINHLYQLNLKEEDVDFKTVIWELQKQRLLPRSARVKEEQDAHKKWPAKQTAEGCLVCAKWTNSPECG